MATPIYQTYIFDATQIGGCTLWLDGADPLETGSPPATGALATWYDKSSNAFNATSVTSPTYNASINGVVFNGGTQFMSNVSYRLNLSSRSFFLVLAETTRASVAGVFPQFPTTGNDYSTTTGLTIETSNGLRFYGNSGGYISDIGNPTLLAKAIYNDNMNGTQGSSFLNGTNTSNNVANYTAGTCIGYALGQRYINSAITTANPFNGTIYEILVYNNPLSTTNRQTIEGYLAWKWNLQSSLPANHPYKKNPPFMNTYTLPVTLTAPIPMQTNLVFLLPTQISGCQLWFDASDPTTFSYGTGTAVSEWRDKSSNAYSVVQTTSGSRPTRTASMQNGLAGVQFATNTFLTQTATLMPNFTAGANTSVFVAARNASVNTGWNIFNTVWFTPAGGNATSRYHFSFNQVTVDGTTLFTNGVLVGQVTSNAVAASANAILGFTASATSQTIHTNGSTNSYAGTTLPDATGTTQFIFNENRNNSGVGADVAIFEMVGFNTQLTASQIQQVEGYLAWKWGMQSNLPSGHPYASISFPPLPSIQVPPRLIGGVWLPNSISGLALWLDAADLTTITTSGSTITAIQDKSGTNKAITITNTVSYIPKQAIVFTNSTGVFTVAGMPAAPYDIVTVATANSSITSYRTLLRTANAPGTHPILLQLNTNNLGMWDSAAFYQFGSLTMTANEKALLYTTMASNRTLQAAKNGTISLTASSPAGNESIITVIGNATLGGGQPWGTLQEIVIYNTTLTFAQRQQTEGYLAWKWGLQGTLPNNHPFKLFPPSP